MSEAIPVAELIRRLEAGDQQATEQLFARYAQQLTHLAEQHLSRKVATRVSGEDVVQSVFRTFFRRVAKGEFRVDCSAQIWGLLMQITMLKTRAKARYHTAGPRDVGKEQAGGDEWLREIVVREPGPEEAAILVDQIEALLRGLPEVYAQVLDYRLQGYNVSDIARQLDVSRQTVHRMLNLLQKRLSDTSSQLGG